MPIIYPDQGLEQFLRQGVSANLTLRLYVNDDVAPSRNSIYEDLSTAAWAGYAPIVLTPGDIAASGVIGNVGYLLWPPCAFLNSTGAPVTFYGWAITIEGADTFILALDQLGATTIEDGESFVMVPAIGDASRDF